MSARTSSGTLRGWLCTARAEECDQMTGAFDCWSACFAVASYRAIRSLNSERERTKAYRCMREVDQDAKAVHLVNKPEAQRAASGQVNQRPCRSGGRARTLAHREGGLSPAKCRTSPQKRCGSCASASRSAHRARGTGAAPRESCPAGGRCDCLNELH